MTTAYHNFHSFFWNSTPFFNFSSSCIIIS